MAVDNDSAPSSMRRPNLFGYGPGSHIVGWDPAPAKDMFSFSDFQSVSNLYAVKGLALLSEMAALAGNAANATAFAATSATLRKNVMAQMWDAKAERFCDGCPKFLHIHTYNDLSA